MSLEKSSPLGPFKPTLILHGGAGAPSRANLPPVLWAKYHASLLKYLTETRKLLGSGTSALDAACHAVTLLEDDILFNCGRGSVFTERGGIEMEASVMVCSVNPAGPPAGGVKRAAAVSMIRNTRHPILLAKEVLVTADSDDGLGGTSTMHCHLSGPDVEEWGWTEKALEKKPSRWFWTKRRWEEHRRGLGKNGSYSFADLLASLGSSPEESLDEFDYLEGQGPPDLPSQGTVGAVCLDSWGNLAVATSTGGLTNKKSGRIGDTPTIGAGFWAEAWDEDNYNNHNLQYGQAVAHQPLSEFRHMPVLDQIMTRGSHFLTLCLNASETNQGLQHYKEEVPPPAYTTTASPSSGQYRSPSKLRVPLLSTHQPIRERRRALALSGTGNGDSFLRTDACRTAAAVCRLDSSSPLLSDAVRAIVGPNGLLQRSAKERWGKTGEGQGGIIGIEVIDEPGPESEKKSGRAVFDFNCNGMFRAYYEVDEATGQEKPKVMVFREEYEAL